MTEPIDPFHGRDAVDDHDRGLAFDLRTLASRRSAIAVFGLGTVAVLAAGSFGGPPDDAEANTAGTAADGSACVKDPGETAGPFPGDGTNVRDGQTVNVLTESGVVRQDLRPSFGGMTGDADGVRIDLTLTLVSVKAGCAPLAGMAVYLWHADAGGRYSLYDLDDRNYLRGVGLSDAAGVVRFTTVFPGCYAGRWPHMHFEVFANAAAASTGATALLTSQFALPADAAAAVYADSRYADSLRNLGRVDVASDMIFGNNTPEQIAQQTLAVTGSAAEGLAGTALIGIVV